MSLSTYQTQAFMHANTHTLSNGAKVLIVIIIHSYIHTRGSMRLNKCA